MTASPPFPKEASGIPFAFSRATTKSVSLLTNSFRVVATTILSLNVGLSFAAPKK